MSVFILEKRFPTWEQDRWEFVDVYTSLEAVQAHHEQTFHESLLLVEVPQHRMGVINTWRGERLMVLGDYKLEWRVTEMEPR